MNELKEMPKYQLNYASRRVPCPVCTAVVNGMCVKRGTYTTRSLKTHPQRIARFKESTIYREWQKKGDIVFNTTVYT